VITAHQGDAAAYTWRLQNFTLGEHVLKPPTSKKRKADSYPDADHQAAAPVTAVAMSQCGNYGLVGRANGTVDRYNMQSGLHRGSYNRYDLLAVLIVTYQRFALCTTRVWGFLPVRHAV